MAAFRTSEANYIEFYFTAFINFQMHEALFCTGMTFRNCASFNLTRGISAFGRYTYRCSASIEKKGCLLIPSLFLELDASWTLCTALTYFKLPRCSSFIIYADADVHLVSLASLLDAVY